MGPKVWALACKELKGYFKSPLAYIILLSVLGLFHTFFYMILDQNHEASLRDILKVMEFMLIFIVPLLTMKLFAEEKFTGTMEFLMTTPTSPGCLVLGKYLGTLIFFTFLLGMTGIYYVIMQIFSAADSWPMLVGYAGLWLEGAFFIAVGLCLSATTRYQVLAAMLTYMVLFVLYFVLSFITYFNGVAEAVIRAVSILTHSENFFVGIVTFEALVYFISGSIFALLLTRCLLARDQPRVGL